MAVEALIARMEADARVRIAALHADADAAVAAIEAACAQAASLDQSQRLAARRAERLRAFAVERARAHRGAATSVLSAEHAFVDHVFARTLAFAADADARFAAAMPQVLDAVVGHLGGQAATLRCPPALAAALRRCAASRSELDVVADDTVPTGFIATSRDGNCTIDCTLRARLNALRPRLQAALLARAPR